MTDPLRDHAAAQPGIATYPTMLGTPPIQPWTPLRAERATQPAQTAADAISDPGEGERTHKGSSGAATGLSGRFAIPAEALNPPQPDVLDVIIADLARAEYHAIGEADPRCSQVAASSSQVGSSCGAGGPLPAELARPRPAPRPPWWRQALDRITRTHRKD